MKELDYPFDASYLMQKKRSLKRRLLEKEGLIPKKIAVMSGSTVGEVKHILELFLLHYGIKPEFYEGEYALFYENLVFDDGSLAAFQPDIIYIHTSNKNIKNYPSQTDSEALCAEKLEAEFAKFETVWKAALGFGCPVIQNNFELPPYRLLGNRDAWDIHGRVNFINQLNMRTAAFASANENFYINDLAYLAACHGLDNWFDEAGWYLYKYALRTEYIPYLAYSVANIVKSIFGKNKKSVILDLDNTLWGGIIGDDGPEGIELGLETPAGMAYSEFQSYLKELSALGIMLNVCSKNEESNALAGFNRADSILKREDFICFKANWDPKSKNIADIAAEINILPESFVFVDDNPAEREIVRQELPTIEVPQVQSPETYIKSLDRAGYFEVTALSADDKKRNEMYKQNAERAALQQSFGDYSSYLKSLQMVCELGPFSFAHAERITQLINKTNQFNLTTRRYNAAEVESLIDNDSYITLFGRLIDKFGDNGIVTAIIGHVQGDALDIDLWIMSCRTFKRNLEHAMFDELVRLCAKRGIKTIKGHYYPTAKNLLVSDFYATIGFEKAEEKDGEKHFAFTAFDGYQNQNSVMEIKHV
ncbi:MAG: HAD-IIIC family phosphatase [Oscillospiraceae bacterium]|nr:HAD-IIIC family phosphatase [Oscillospiraceae bacterium]